MLRKILGLLRSKGIVSLTELSEETGQSRDFVRLLLEELEKRGEISRCSINTATCQDCPVKKKCQQPEKETFYVYGKTRE
ncbi:MAG: hypothetical protein GYA35_06220 [Thermoanaerobaculaceae bacterium]|nr:hypothetical protein [Thermoanaerobaculaceae bacterium]